MTPESETTASLRRRGKRYLVGGVSSNFRIDPYTREPMYPSRADGAFFHDVSGKKYIDYFMGHGAVLLGHNHPAIKKAVLEAVEKGFFAEFDDPSTIELAQRITETIPCAESVRYANSGSEATLLALRLARGYTGRERSPGSS